MKKHRGGTLGNVTKLTLPKNLTRQKAVLEAVKKVGGDFRGFTYDSKTGKASVV